MRHAQAQLEQYGKSDRERTITMTGMHEIDAMRQRIHGKLKDVSLILCSNARRTRQTLDGIKPVLPNSAEILYDDNLYNASTDTLWHKIHTTPPAHKSIMIMGHNPAASQIAQLVDAKRPSLPTCGAVVIESTAERWLEVTAANSRVIDFLTP